MSTVPPLEKAIESIKDDSTNHAKHIEVYYENKRKFIFSEYHGMCVLYHVKSGYFNAGKLCSDNGKAYKSLNRNQWYQSLLDYALEQFSNPDSILSKSYNVYDNTLIFEFKKGFTSKVSGTYVHPFMLSFVCQWITHDHSVLLARLSDAHDKANDNVKDTVNNMRVDGKVDDTIVNNNKDNVNDNVNVNDNSDINTKVNSTNENINVEFNEDITEEQFNDHDLDINECNDINALREIIKSQRLLIDSLQQEIKNANTCMKRIEGSLKVNRHWARKDVFHVFADTKMQYPCERTVEVIPMYNANDTLRIMNFYAKNNCIDHVKLINTNIFSAETYRVMREFINDVAENSLQVKIDYDLLISRLLGTEHYERYYLPSLFEIFCSQQLNIPLFKYELTESVGLTKQDRGCDLFDIERKITGQCKYYTKGILSTRYLLKYLEFVDSMEYPNNYLVLNESILLSSLLTFYDENMNVINHSGCAITIRKLYEFTHTEFDESSEDLIVNLNLKIYIKTPAEIPIELLFIRNKLFDEFVNTIEVKYDTQIAHDDFISMLTAVTIRHIHMQEENKKAYLNGLEVVDKAEKYKERIHETKDEQFVKSEIQDQREFLKDLIAKNPKGIEASECIKIINDTFGTKYDNIRFGHKFSDLYHHESNSGFPVVNGKKMILPVRHIDEEIEFIRTFINHQDFPVKDYIKVHNERFNTFYDVNSFAHKFTRLFKNDGQCFLRKTVDGIRSHYLELIDSDRVEYVTMAVCKILNNYGVLPLSVVLLYLRFIENINYTPKSFKQEFTSFRTKAERFTGQQKENLKQFLNASPDIVKQKYEEITSTRKMTSPVFIYPSCDL